MQKKRKEQATRNNPRFSADANRPTAPPGDFEGERRSCWDNGRKVMHAVCAFFFFFFSSAF